MNDAVILRGMRFHALLGILPHERETPQPVEVDLTAWLTRNVDTSASNPEETVVDYRTLYDIAAHEVTHSHNEYIEHVAARIAERVLEDTRVTRAEVVVRKPHVGLPGPLDGAEVRIQRWRSE